MAGITLAQAEEHLNLWLEADKAVSMNQSYEIGGRKYTRSDVAEIRKNISFWNNKVRSLSGRKGMVFTQGVPL